MPLATILTSNSSGRGSVSSIFSTLNGPNLSRATAAVICMRRFSLREWLVQLAVRVLGRIDDHLLVARHVLIETVTFDVLKLHHDDARIRPFTKLVELDVADNRTERVGMNIGGELLIIESSGRRDGLLQHLHRRIGKGRLIEPERIDAGILGARLIFAEKGLDTGEVHLRAGNEEMIVDDAVELLRKLLDQR